MHATPQKDRHAEADHRPFPVTDQSQDYHLSIGSILRSDNLERLPSDAQKYAPLLLLRTLAGSGTRKSPEHGTAN